MLGSDTLNRTVVKGNGEVVIPTKFTVTDFVLNTIPTGIIKDDMTRDAVIDVVTGEKLNHSDLRRQIAQLASGLTNKYHLRRGDVIALFSPNHINYVTILLAALSVGITVTTVNNYYSYQQVSYQLDHSKAKLIVSCPEIATVAKEAVTFLNIDIPIVSIDDSYNQAIESFQSLLSDQPYDNLKFKEGECQDTTAIIVYSSGTTGVPKGIVISHYNLIAAITQCQPSMFRDNPNTKYLMGNTPFFHIYGITVPILHGVHRHITILTIKKFDPILFLQTIAKFQLDFLLLTPPLIQFLATQPIVDEYDLSSIKKIFTGGSALQFETFKKVVNRLGCKVEQAYGLTECSPSISTADTDGMPWDSVGRLLPNISAKIVDPVTREISNIGVKGELWVKGPNIMKGYLNNEKATRAIFDTEGFMCTGDIAFFDHNRYLYIFDRSSELIKYRHHRISPSYLESILLSHPSILDCCVVSIPYLPDEEHPRAYLVLNPSTDPTSTLLTEIETFTHSKLESHEYFRGGFQIVPQILKSPAGKILRHAMRDQKY